MAIKKAYVELVEFLENNANSKVKTLMDDIKLLCSAKATSGTAMFKKDADGNVTHVFCYYHKKWEVPCSFNEDGTAIVEDGKVEFGKKATSPTGLSNMCKEGTSNWTKQDRAFKKESGELLDKVASGEVAPSDIAGLKEDHVRAKAIIVPREDGLGVDSID